MKIRIIKEYGLILFGSVLYALSTVLFVFGSELLLGGTSAISVMLSRILPFSPAKIHVVLNTVLLISALFILGKEMAIKTFVGSSLTTVFVGLFEYLFALKEPIINNPYLTAVLAGTFIAIASGFLFYVNSSSGGTDIIALIIKKFSDIKIGRALLVTDILIVIIGGLSASIELFICSIIGLIIKTLGTDTVISIIKKIAAPFTCSNQKS